MVFIRERILKTQNSNIIILVQQSHAINLLKIPSNLVGADSCRETCVESRSRLLSFLVIQDDVQDGRQRVVRSGNLRKQVNFR